MTNALDTNPAPSSLPAIVVFGRDDGGKPHASRFNDADAELATKAAALMGMHVLRLETPEHHELATKLPAGRVFASGKGFVPFVKAALFGSLATMAGIDPDKAPVRPGANAEPAKTGDQDDSAAPAKASKSDPTAIMAGTVVLACEGKDEGWWEAVVVKSQHDLVTLKWRDFPDLPQIVRRHDQLAQLPSAHAG